MWGLNPQHQPVENGDVTAKPLRHSSSWYYSPSSSSAYLSLLPDIDFGSSVNYRIIIIRFNLKNDYFFLMLTSYLYHIYVLITEILVPHAYL